MFHPGIRIIKSTLILLALTCTANAQSFTPKQYPEVYQPTEASLQTANNQPEWFKDAKLGIYFHWGLYSVPAFQTEWYAKWLHEPVAPEWAEGSYQNHVAKYGDPSEFGYHHFKPMFKAEEYDPEEWVQLFKSSGARFTGPVVQHHDGFAMWKSSVNPNNAFDEGPKRDLAGEFLMEAKRQGLKTITTFHHSLTMDDINPKTGKSTRYFPYHENYFTSTNDSKLKWMYGNVSVEEYLPYWENIVYEVVDNYSPDMIWFDSGSRRIPTENFLNVFAHHFNALEARGEEGVVFTKEKKRLTDIRLLDQEQGGLRDMPEDYWMTDVTLSNKGWCYIQNQTYKDIDLLIRNMIDVWSKRGIVLLNVSPTASGVINQEQRDRLKALGEWMKIYGEAIYDTRAHAIYGYGDAAFEKGKHADQSATMQYSERDIRFTQSKTGDRIFVFLLGQPEEGVQLNIKHVLDGMPNKSVIRVTQIGCSTPVDWTFDKGELLIQAPKATSLNEVATGFRVDLAKNEKYFEASLESLKQYETPEWFKDAKFGIWNVWGPYSVAEQGEWYARNLYIMDHEMDWQVQGPHHRKVWGHPSEFGYKDFIPMWKAENFDPDALLQKFKRAGAKYYTSIATFHDNYDLFDSKYTRWDSVETGPGKDIVKMLQDATHKAGLRYGTTTHLARSLWWWQVNKGTAEEPYDGVDPDYEDLYHPAYDKDNPDRNILEEWAELWNKRIKDLIDNYEIDLLYFDGGILFGDKGYDVVSHFYNNNLERHDGQENGVMCIKNWPRDENNQLVPFVATMDFEKMKAGSLRKDYWQTDDHTGCWGYTAGVEYKSTNYVVDKLIDIVSKNGNLLLNVPLKADGTLDAESDQFLEEIGEWMDVNGEAIYGTRHWKIYGEGPIRRDAETHYDIDLEEGFNYENLRFTTKGSDLFVFQLDWPADRIMTVNSLGRKTELNSKIVTSVTMVGTNETLVFNQTTEQLVIRLPKKKHCEHAFAVRVELEE